MSDLLSVAVPFKAVAITLVLLLLFCSLLVWFVMKKLYQAQHAHLLQQIDSQNNENQQLSQERETYQKQSQELLIQLKELEVLQATNQTEQEYYVKAIEEKQKSLQKIESENREQANFLEVKKEELAKANETIETMKVQQAEQLKRFEEKEQFLKDQEQQMRETFENLANQILEKKGKQFSEQQNKELNELLKPFQHDLATFKQEAETARKHEIEKQGQLGQELKQLMELNQKLSQDANNLTKALKNESQTQGAWGEMILEKVLESVGLTKGREYKVQESFQDEQDRRKRPDALVYLPENKVIIIDAKTSLEAYTDFCNATNEDTRQESLKAHVKSVENHIKDLAKKEYASLPDLQDKTLDMVLMFVPIEGAFSVALQHQTSLCNDAFQKRIFLVSPTTLFVSLYAVKALWNMEDQAKNVREIAERASKMLDKFSSFAQDLEKVGKQIGLTQQTYDEACKKLKTGKGNLISQATQIQALGVPHKKQLPNSFLEEAKIDE